MVVVKINMDKAAIITSDITVVFENALNSPTLNSKHKYLTTLPK